MKNIEIANIFNEIANILELKEENPFRIRAYRRAALNLEGLTEDIEEIAKRNELTEIPGIGKDLAEKIQKFLSTGHIEYYERLKKETPSILLELVTIPGIGPKTANLLYKNLKFKSIQDLEEMARLHKIAGLPGLKEKTEENIVRGIEFIKKGKERMPLGFALPIANDIISNLKKLPETKRITIAGSVRRMKETVKDIDILVTSIDPETVMAEFIKLPQIMDVLAHGSTKSSVLTKDGIQVDLRVVEPESFGAGLAYFTGSQAHNIRLREMAVKKGWKINEYGVFNERTNSKIAGKEEEEIYKILGLPFIPPELREDTGEVEAAIKNRLPILIELKDIKGDLHVHSKWSDGSDSLEVLAEAAQRRGYEYIVITDHSKSLPVAGGLKEEEIIKQVKGIERLNKTFKGFRLLTGAEVDILSDGKLAFSDDILSMLDFAVAAVHSGFKQTKEVLTKRLIKAMQNKFVRCIVHPTGRLMGVREGYEIDFEEIYKAARDTNTAIEINAYPERLDLTDINCHRAKEVGVKLAISTDAHTKDQLDNILFGISVARRGWIEKDDVLNTLSLNDLLEGIKK